jgi:hypothetical protein
MKTSTTVHANQRRSSLVQTTASSGRVLPSARLASGVEGASPKAGLTVSAE